MRDSYYDNIKGFLIFLVVFGHFMGVNRVWYGEELHWLIYSFHMPAFIFLAGYFSKKEGWRDNFRKSFFHLLVPYLFFQILYQFLFTTQFNHALTFHWEKPHYTLWFLVSLICWKFLLQLVTRWKVFLIVFAVAWIGHRFWIEDMRFFSIGRTISFLPFFLLGYYWKTVKQSLKPSNILAKISRFRMVIGGVGFLTLVTLYWLGVITIPKEWFYGLLSYPTDYPAENALYLLIYQVYATMFSLCMVFFFMMMIPSSTSIWTTFGKTSLSIYLFHGFLAQWMRINGWVLHREPIWETLLIVIVLAFGALLLLSQPVFGRFIHSLSNWKMPTK